MRDYVLQITLKFRHNVGVKVSIAEISNNTYYVHKYFYLFLPYVVLAQ